MKAGGGIPAISGCSVGHRTPVLPLEAQGSTTSLARSGFSTLSLLLLHPATRRANGPTSSDRGAHPTPVPPQAAGAAEERLQRGEGEKRHRSSPDDLGWGAARAQAGNPRQGKSQAPRPRFTLMWSASCRVQSSACSARWMLYRCCGERPAEISTPQVLPHMQANKTNEEIHKKTPNTESLAQFLAGSETPGATPPSPCERSAR